MSCCYDIKPCVLEAVEIAQWLRLFIVFPADLNSDSNTHIGWLIVNHNSSIRGFDILFWPLQEPENTWHIYTQIITIINNHVLSQILNLCPLWTVSHLRVLCLLEEQPGPWTGDSNLWSPHASNFTVRKDFLTLPHALSGQDRSIDLVSGSMDIQTVQGIGFSVVISEHVWLDMFKVKEKLQIKLFFDFQSEAKIDTSFNHKHGHRLTVACLCLQHPTR